MTPMLSKILVKKMIPLSNKLYDKGSEDAIKYAWKDNTRVQKEFLISFVHDDKYNDIELISVYNRRLARFYDNVLNDTNELKLLIRMQDIQEKYFCSSANLQDYDEIYRDNCVCKCDNIDDFCLEQSKFDINSIIDFNIHLKNNFPCKFLIIYLSPYLETDFKYEFDIIFIKLHNFDFVNYKTWSYSIDNVLTKYKSEIQFIINQSNNNLYSY